MKLLGMVVGRGEQQARVEGATGGDESSALGVDLPRLMLNGRAVLKGVPNDSSER